MKTMDSITDVGASLKGAVDNDYAIEQLIAGADDLRSAFERSRKRRVDPVGDRKFRRCVEKGLSELAEGSRALATGRDHPRRHWGRRIAVVVGLAGIGAAGYVARNLQARS